jgi:hypothetical protein
VSKPQYGHQHQQRRAALLPRAYGQPCPMCGVLMLPTMRLDLDHSTPHTYGGTVGDLIVHASCNRRAGQAISARRRRKRPPTLGSSGSW